MSGGVRCYDKNQTFYEIINNFTEQGSFCKKSYPE